MAEVAKNDIFLKKFTQIPQIAQKSLYHKNEDILPSFVVFMHN